MCEDIECCIRGSGICCINLIGALFLMTGFGSLVYGVYCGFIRVEDDGKHTIDQPAAIFFTVFGAVCVSIACFIIKCCSRFTMSNGDQYELA